MAGKVKYFNFFAEFLFSGVKCNHPSNFDNFLSQFMPFESVLTKTRKKLLF